MPPKRKVVFDPEAAGTNTKRKKAQEDAIHESASAFFGVAEKYESTVVLSDDCNPAALELF